MKHAISPVLMSGLLFFLGAISALMTAIPIVAILQDIYCSINPPPQPEYREIHCPVEALDSWGPFLAGLMFILFLICFKWRPQTDLVKGIKFLLMGVMAMKALLFAAAALILY